MIEKYFTETVSVERLSTVSENKKSFSVHIASLSCMIQPLDDQITKDISTGFGKEWKLFCAVADIQEGDRITWEGDEYRVAATRIYSKYGTKENRHLEARIRLFKS